jgi:hypothetical protein
VADQDYVPQQGTLTFDPGVKTRTITLSVLGDTKLEDYESFRVQLSAPVGAQLGAGLRKVEIRNDEIPVLAIRGTSAVEGRLAVFEARLRQRYDATVTVRAVTRDGSARAPSDYAPKTTSIAFASGTKGPVPVRVATKGDTKREADETFALNAGAPGMLAAAVATVDDGPPRKPPPPVCPAGSNPTPAAAPAPPSPSSPGTLLPPAEVIGSGQWDLVFNDEFGDPAATAAKWSTGTRTGDRTLEVNRELQWYEPGNSALTTDTDGHDTLGVLRQTLRRETVPGEMYTVRTLSRLYPRAQCPSLYDPTVDNTKPATNTNPTRTPYRFTSGMLNSAKSFGFRYGYVETRVKMPKGFALWPALWLRDWHDWHYEIDALEGLDREARTFRAGYWWGNGSNYSTEKDGGDVGIAASGEPCRQRLPVPAESVSASACSLAGSVDLSAGFHTVGLWWTPAKYELYLDGVKRWTSPPGADVANTYQHLILDLAFGNNSYDFDWAKEPVRPLDPDLFDLTTYFPKRTVEWDYVRVWQPATALDTCTPPACR